MPLSASQKKYLYSPLQSNCHAIWTGKLLEITYIHNTREYHHVGKRGKVRGFTPSARLRMLRMVATIDWQRISTALFITLTYPPGTDAYDMRRRNQQRYVFLRNTEKYLQREIACLWRIEWLARRTGTERGKVYPHFHLLLPGVQYVPSRDIRNWWREALGCTGPLATDVRAVKKGEIAGKYVSKYCSKLPASSSLDIASYLNSPGRHWGIHRKNLLPRFTPRTFYYISPSELQLLENAGCMAMKHFVRGTNSGFTLLGDLAEKVAKEIVQRRVDVDPFRIYDD